jgi:hypothetical protein
VLREGAGSGGEQTVNSGGSLGTSRDENCGFSVRDYLDRIGKQVPPSQRKALADSSRKPGLRLINTRTPDTM